MSGGGGHELFTKHAWFIDMNCKEYSTAPFVSDTGTGVFN